MKSILCLILGLYAVNNIKPNILTRILTSLCLLDLLSTDAAFADAIPNPNHYQIQGDSIRFIFNAEDADMVILDVHPELKTISFQCSENSFGIDPRLVPIKVTDAGFAHVAACTNLENLFLSQMHPLEVTDAGLKSIEGLRRLRRVILDFTPFNSAGLSHLEGLTNIQELWVEQNENFDNASMGHIACLKNLRDLRFHRSAVTDAGLAKLKDLSQLEDLQLGGTQVGDAGLKVIGGFANLKTLDLQHTRVTDAGLKYLKPLTSLGRLSNEDSVTSVNLVLPVKPDILDGPG
jgi:Leucine-rich repeat (LRR) protein